MKTASQKTFDRDTRDGVWEAMTDVNSFGTVEARNCRTGRRFTVVVNR
jgi:hypothetical protein